MLREEIVIYKKWLFSDRPLNWKFIIPFSAIKVNLAMSINAKMSIFDIGTTSTVLEIKV